MNNPKCLYNRPWILSTALLTLSFAANAQSSAITVLHTFTGGSDGRNPLSGPIVGRDGSLFGTTNYGGTPLPNGNGTIYRLTPPASTGESWTKTTLYSFNWAVDGGTPYAGLAEGANGVLYGTNYSGGPLGYGTVYQLAPPTAAGGDWTYSVLYNFTGGADAGQPYSGLVIGPGGVLFGTTQGGLSGAGSVFKLTPPSTEGGAWTETTLYAFTGGADGKSPSDPYLHQKDGVIYGATVFGGAYGNGAIYSLTPQGEGQPWKETVLYSFTSVNGTQPEVDAMGPYGELYGTTNDFSTGADGSVFELVPPVGPPYGWTYTLLYTFKGGDDGRAPSAVSLNAEGNLVGTSQQGGLQISPCGGGCGVLFEIVQPAASGEQWTEKTIYTFRNQSDGSNPQGLIAQKNGVLYAVSSGDDQGTTIGNGAVLSWTP
jgi:uncharacterized repeat protein (TIGR03803 family)